ncbi:MAG: DUF3500 domain-containing protein [Acidobacteria bacterium]|nr:MAG: DUF3500 domain-containing protein [Acidobacteriota bacterium]
MTFRRFTGTQAGSPDKRRVVDLVRIGLLLSFFGLLIGHVDLAGQRRSAGAMTDAAKQFLSSLQPEQRSKATFAFSDEQRFDWHYIPRERKGLPFKEMGAAQRESAEKLLAAALSARGLTKVHHVIRDLEVVLRELEAGRGDGRGRGPIVRDPELYYFTVFGTPGDASGWGWRVEGHHVSLNFAFLKGELVAWTPEFLGSNPAEVRQGPHQGLRVLGVEEDLGFQLVQSLNEEQRKVAILQNEAPNEIVTTNSRRVKPLSPDGVPASQMTAAQKQVLRNLVTEYASRMADDLASERMKKLDSAGFDKVHFAWAGGQTRKDPHYYRVQGPTFLIELDNVQNQANHIHAVWRDFNGDFGEDLLQRHYATVQHRP